MTPGADPRPAEPRVVAGFRWQAVKCRELGSPFTAGLLEAAAAGLESGGAWAALVGRWPGDVLADALPLRVAGALHGRVLEGDRALASHWPRPDRAGDPPSAWAAAEACAADEPADLLARLRSPPQTNESGRALALFPGLLAIADRLGIVLHLYELGASAGLNLHMDSFAYATDTWRRRGRVPITGDWRGGPPPLNAPLRIRRRAGCDRNPLDPADPADRRRLQAYVWADQFDRQARLQAALDLAAEAGVRVERADAADWLEARLAQRPADAASVVYHSVFWQYASEAARSRMAAALARAGAAATTAAPLAWLRLEPEAGPSARYPLTLTLWPGGETRVLGEADPHGRWVDWRG